MKSAVIINGIGAKLGKSHQLLRILEKQGYEVECIELLDPGVDINNIELKSEPELIAGFSLGGLVIPKLAYRFPKAKVLLVATGARIKAGNRINNWAYKLALKKLGVKIALRVLNWPENILIRAYAAVNPVSGTNGYVEDMKRNIHYFKSLPESKWNEVMDFMKKTDNRQRLGSLTNECLIISGRKDRLMPLERGEELRLGIKRNKMLVTSGGHYDVLDHSGVEEINKFLKV